MSNIKKNISLASLLLLLNGCAVVAVGAVAAAAGTSASVATDPRSSGIVVDDKTIQSSLFGKYANTTNYPDSNIEVTVYNKTVLLTGQIKNNDQKINAEFVAKTYPGVIKVYDYLIIGLPLSLSTTTNDAFITTQVKSKLINTKGINSNSIKVVTNNKEVYLFGVITQSEAELAAKATANINGVNKVVTLFEYVRNSN